VIDLGNVHIQPSESVRSLGVVIDKYHAKALRDIRKGVTTDVALTIASTMVGARLDYCNAIRHETSKSNIQKLQLTQNSIGRIVSSTRQ